MITQNRGTIAFAVCGSFCTLEAALQSARALTAQGWQLLPVMSFAARQDTRFGTGNYWKEQLEAAAGHPVLPLEQVHLMVVDAYITDIVGNSHSRFSFCDLFLFAFYHKIGHLYSGNFTKFPSSFLCRFR